MEGEKEWKQEGDRKEAQKGLQDYAHQLYVVARESLLMAPLMPGAYLHAFLAMAARPGRGQRRRHHLLR